MNNKFEINDEVKVFNELCCGVNLDKIAKDMGLDNYVVGKLPPDDLSIKYTIVGYIKSPKYNDETIIYGIRNIENKREYLATEDGLRFFDF